MKDLHVELARLAVSLGHAAGESIVLRNAMEDGDGQREDAAETALVELLDGLAIEAAELAKGIREKQVGISFPEEDQPAPAEPEQSANAS